MNTQSTAAITTNFVDVALTVRSRMLNVAGIAKIIEDMEDKSAQSAEMFNPIQQPHAAAGDDWQGQESTKLVVVL